ncbi:MAG: hypothetical protein H7144_17420 [Burkholderiales bacterium]|nr:hypothetical protein [Phycisphaerae bacterium]
MQSGERKMPSYGLHRPSGQAVVTINGRDRYLGLHRSRHSRDEYDRLIAEWLAAGRAPVDDGLTVNELVDAFRQRGDIPESHKHAYKAVMSIIVRLYGRRPATSFGPLALKAVREQMVAAGQK